ncbi:hypothetical protein ACOMHN_038386 [Nucella lapillus]
MLAIRWINIFAWYLKDTDESMDDRNVKQSDPLLLTKVAVDHILEFVDDDALLTGRLVCKNWKTEIRKRNALWKRRCERLGAHESDKAFPSDTDFFSLYLNLKGILHGMASGHSWSFSYNDPSQCDFHREVGYKHVDRQAWVLSVATDIMQKKFWGKKIIARTKRGELIVLDEEERTVEWRTGKQTAACFKMFEGSIFVVTFSGDIEVYSLDGKCEVTETGGKLEGVTSIFPHLNAPFILLLIRETKLFLVDKKRQIFPLRLPPFQPSVKIKGLKFNIKPVKVDYGDDQLVLVIWRRSYACFVMFTTRGESVRQLTLKFNRLYELSVDDKPGPSRCKVVYLSERQVVAHSLQFTSRGITVEQLWKKALPAHLPAEDAVAGKKFVLCFGKITTVFRMDDGTPASFFPLHVG